MTTDLGDNVLYMKVGTHAREDLADIIERKQREIAEEGFSLWGYGGNTCHPTSMVQPFVFSNPGPIVLAMQPMTSNHFAEPVRAEEFSADGIDWHDVPAGINVLGSRYALSIESLDEVDLQLDLADTRVAVGNSLGRLGSDYVKGRVDKACLKVLPSAGHDPVKPVSIRLLARLTSPYAVFLRN